MHFSYTLDYTLLLLYYKLNKRKERFKTTNCWMNFYYTLDNHVLKTTNYSMHFFCIKLSSNLVNIKKYKVRIFLIKFLVVGH